MTTTKRRSKERITEIDIAYLYFAGKYPGATAEALSLIRTTEPNRFTPGGELPQIRSLEQRLFKLVRLNSLQRYRNPLTGITHYGITEYGVQLLEASGLKTTYRKLEGLSLERVQHYYLIAQIAAQFASPINYFDGKIPGATPIPLDRIISENEMRAAYEKVNQTLKENKTKGEGVIDFSDWRKLTHQELDRKIQQGLLQPGEKHTLEPALFTIATPKDNTTGAKHIHQPDIAIHLDHGQQTASNWLIEIELTQKSNEGYKRILHTFANELRERQTYERVIYFTPKLGIKNRLQQIDNYEQLGLFASKRLQVLPIEHRDGTPIKLAKRITF